MYEHFSARVNDKNINYSKLVINEKEQKILRNLALRVAELSAKPEQNRKKSLWLSHNALRRTKPLIVCDPENGWNEIIIEEKLECENEIPRYWEVLLRKEIFWGEKMGDDKVIEPYFDIPYIYSESDWGLHESRIGGDITVYRSDGGSYSWVSPITDYSELSQIKSPVINVDYVLTNRVIDFANQIFGDILEVRITMKHWWWSVGLTDELAFLRGLENIMYDVYDRPEDLHKLMSLLRDGTISKLNYLQENELLSLNSDGSYVGSGGFGWSNELPQKDFDGKVRLIDLWGMSESQVTVGLSPSMFKEFIFPYQLPILELFGLNCYGCCEPLNARWEIIKEIPRLRRVSVSAWADIEDMAEKLQDKYILSIKPHPAVLAKKNINEDKIRKEIRNILQLTRKCRVEIIMKDNHTICHNPMNVIRWTQIAQEEANYLE
ncbi:MAG: hypothetical protein AB1767_11900 [Bacillota bacterium]